MGEQKIPHQELVMAAFSSQGSLPLHKATLVNSTFPSQEFAMYNTIIMNAVKLTFSELYNHSL